MKIRPALLGAATAALLAVAVAVPAHAGTTTAGDDASAQWMTCHDGKPVRHGHLRLGTIRVSGMIWLKVDGTINACVRPKPDDLFAITGFYGPPSQPGRYGTIEYTNTSHGYFRTEILLNDYADLRAVCLSSREGASYRTSHRIDCVAASWTEQDQQHGRLPRIGRHLPTHATVVRRVAEEEPGHRPGCPACWG